MIQKSNSNKFCTHLSFELTSTPFSISNSTILTRLSSFTERSFVPHAHIITENVSEMKMKKKRFSLLNLSKETFANKNVTVVKFNISSFFNQKPSNFIGARAYRIHQRSPI